MSRGRRNRVEDLPTSGAWRGDLGEYRGDENDHGIGERDFREAKRRS